MTEQPWWIKELAAFWGDGHHRVTFETRRAAKIACDQFSDLTAAPASAAEPEDQELATRPIAVEICDAVLEWIVKHDFGDRDDELSVAEVIAVLDCLYEEENRPGDPKAAEEVLRKLTAAPASEHKEGCNFTHSPIKLCDCPAAAPPSAAEPVRWQAKYHSDTVWLDIPEHRAEELRMTGRCDVRGLYPCPPTPWQGAIEIIEDYGKDAQPDSEYRLACNDLIECFRGKTLAIDT